MTEVTEKRKLVEGSELEDGNGVRFVVNLFHSPKKIKGRVRATKTQNMVEFDNFQWVPTPSAPVMKSKILSLSRNVNPGKEKPLRSKDKPLKPKRKNKIFSAGVDNVIRQVTESLSEKKRVDEELQAADDVAASPPVVSLIPVRIGRVHAPPCVEDLGRANNRLSQTFVMRPADGSSTTNTDFLSVEECENEPGEKHMADREDQEEERLVEFSSEREDSVIDDSYFENKPIFVSEVLVCAEDLSKINGRFSATIAERAFADCSLKTNAGTAERKETESESEENLTKTGQEEHGDLLEDFLSESKVSDVAEVSKDITFILPQKDDLNSTGHEIVKLDKTTNTEDVSGFHKLSGDRESSDKTRIEKWNIGTTVSQIEAKYEWINKLKTCEMSCIRRRRTLSMNDALVKALPKDEYESSLNISEQENSLRCEAERNDEKQPDMSLTRQEMEKSCTSAESPGAETNPGVVLENYLNEMDKEGEGFSNGENNSPGRSSLIINYSPNVSSQIPTLDSSYLDSTSSELTESGMSDAIETSDEEILSDVSAKSKSRVDQEVELKIQGEQDGSDSPSCVVEAIADQVADLAIDESTAGEENYEFSLQAKTNETEKISDSEFKSGCSSQSRTSSELVTEQHSSDSTPNKSLRQSTSPEKTPKQIIFKTPEISSLETYEMDDDFLELTPLQHFVLQSGKKYRRSLSIIRNLGELPPRDVKKGRNYERSVKRVIQLQCQGTADEETPFLTISKRVSMSLSFIKASPRISMRNRTMWTPRLPKVSRMTIYETPRASFYFTPTVTPFETTREDDNTLGTPSERKEDSLTQRNTLIPESPTQYTILDLILTICGQSGPCSFGAMMSELSFQGARKLGEGVFGEVFSAQRDGDTNVLKIIPIEGEKLVNGEKQKTYGEILSELIIAKVLHELRFEIKQGKNRCCGFAQLVKISLVRDRYPKQLLELWQHFDDSRGSDNDCPSMFDENQLFIVLEQGNGGTDLETYTFTTAKQALSAFKQILFSLAVAELSVEFEHRDLHWGNVLISKTTDRQVVYTLNGEDISLPTSGIKTTIIDYTLSRINYIEQFPIYNDIGQDPEMFVGTGDYQFEVYRLMKDDVKDDWSAFVPKTNVRWLHYLLDKLLNRVNYSRKSTKIHKENLKQLRDIDHWIETCDSAHSAALRIIENR